MIETILQAAGVPGWEGWTNSPPGGNYVLYFDDVTTDGPDGHTWIRRHDVTLELYEPVADPAVEASMEAAISAQGLQWTKQARYWLKDAQLHQVIYEFTFFEKVRT